MANVITVNWNTVKPKRKQRKRSQSRSWSKDFEFRNFNEKNEQKQSHTKSNVSFWFTNHRKGTIKQRMQNAHHQKQWNQRLNSRRWLAVSLLNKLIFKKATKWQNDPPSNTKRQYTNSKANAPFNNQSWRRSTGPSHTQSTHHIVVSNHE